MKQEEFVIEPLQFLVAAIDSQGGELRIPYSVFISPKGEAALTIDFEDGGATIVLRLVEMTEELKNVATGTDDAGSVSSKGVGNSNLS